MEQLAEKEKECSRPGYQERQDHDREQQSLERSCEGEEGAVLGELLWQPGAGFERVSTEPSSRLLLSSASSGAWMPGHPFRDVPSAGRVSSYEPLLSLRASLWEPVLDTAATVTWIISKKTTKAAPHPSTHPAESDPVGLSGSEVQPGLRSSAFLNPWAGQQCYWSCR